MSIKKKIRLANVRNGAMDIAMRHNRAVQYVRFLEEEFDKDKSAIKRALKMVKMYKERFNGYVDALMYAGYIVDYDIEDEEIIINVVEEMDEDEFLAMYDESNFKED